MDPDIEQNLYAWLRAQGGLVADVHVADGPNGRGLFARRDCAAGTLLLHVPPAATFTADLARASPVGRRVADAGAELSEGGLIAASLAQSRHAGGFWSPFVESLPRSYPAHPVFYGAGEMDALGTTSTAAGVVKVVRDLYGSDAQRIPANVEVDADDYAWAWTSVKSRTFRTTRGHLAMVPVVDLINHASRSNARSDSADDGVRVYARRALAAGEEITIRYGLFNNATLLAIYGFCEDDDVDHDVWIASPSGRCFSVTRRYGDPCTRALFAHLRAGSPAVDQPDAGAEPSSRDNELGVLNWIGSFCDWRLGVLASSASQAQAGCGQTLRMIKAAQDSECAALRRFGVFAKSAARLLSDVDLDMDPAGLAALDDDDYAQALRRAFAS